MKRIATLVLLTAFGTIACGEGELEEVPETAEVEQEEGVGQLELGEETMLGADDIGEDLMATGWVSGVPLPNGFFLRTEDSRVIFVETDRTVNAGDLVRVTGPLVATEAAVFEGWETEAFDAGFEAEWDVETIAYIDAFMVDPIGEGSMEGDMQDGGMNGSGDAGMGGTAGG